MYVTCHGYMGKLRVYPITDQDCKCAPPHPSIIDGLCARLLGVTSRLSSMAPHFVGRCLGFMASIIG